MQEKHISVAALGRTFDTGEASEFAREFVRGEAADGGGCRCVECVRRRAAELNGEGECWC